MRSHGEGATEGRRDVCNPSQEFVVSGLRNCRQTKTSDRREDVRTHDVGGWKRFEEERCEERRAVGVGDELRDPLCERRIPPPERTTQSNDSLQIRPSGRSPLHTKHSSPAANIWPSRTVNSGAKRPNSAPALPSSRSVSECLWMNSRSFPFLHGQAPQSSP
jgi:hypothetical protein